MVYLTEHIKKLKSGLANDNLATLAYYYAKEKNALNQINGNNFSGQELIAAKGYLSIAANETEIQQVNKPAYKGVDITSTIFKFLGAYLATPATLQKRLDQKFEETTFRNQFLISRCVLEFRDKFQDKIRHDATEDSWVFRIIEGVTDFQPADSSRVAKYLQSASDSIDLLILDELLETLIRMQTPANLIVNKSSYDTIIGVLNNFHNASKKIVQTRRKDHQSFAINDEYDVQDILYVILKSIFPNLKEEDPTPRVGVKSNKIDLILREEGILIEVKMIKHSDSNERDFVEQLKNDIQSYRNCQWLQQLIFFVYDPFGKTKDAQNFFDLNGQQSINGTTFTIEVILNPK